MSKFGYRFLIIILLCAMWVTQFVSCMCDTQIMNNTTSIEQEVRHIRNTIGGWEVEFRY